MSLNLAFFIVLGLLAIASGIITITNKNPIVSAIALVFHFFMLAGLYLTLNAQFIAVIQVLVYAGAIMVLVVFVIMLLNLGNEESLKEKFDIQKLLGVLLAIAFVLQIVSILIIIPSGKELLSNNSLEQGTAQAIGKELYSNYIFPFIAISLLLVVAIIGAVVLAKRKLE